MFINKIEVREIEPNKAQIRIINRSNEKVISERTEDDPEKARALIDALKKNDPNAEHAIVFVAD